MELKEIIEAGKPNIVSEKIAEGTMTVRVPFIEADKKTLNGRTYSKNLLSREVDRVQSQIKKRQFLGTGDHPSSGFSDVATASHIVQKLYLDSQGKGFVEMKIVGTERGKSIMTLIDQGASLGVSMRGFGDISSKGIVQDSYKLLGIDIVTNPSYEEGTFSKNDIFESVEFPSGKGSVEEALADAESFIQKILEMNYSTAVDEYGYEHGLEAYKKEKRAITTAAYLEQKGYFESTEQALEYLGETELAKKISGEEEPLTDEQKSARLFSAFQESCTAGYRGDFNEWKEKFPALVEFVTRPIKIIEEEDNPEEEKLISAYQESIDAGFQGTFAEWKEKFPKLVEFTNRKEITREEFAQIEAERCGVTVETVFAKWAADEKRKIEENLRKRAIRNVNRDLMICGESVSKEKLHELIEFELKGLREEYEK